MASAGVILDGAQALRPLKTYSIQFTATDGAATQAIGSQLVRLNTTAAVCVDLENGAVSTATSFRMSADQTEYFRVNIDSTRTLHAKAADSSAGGVIGTLYITEC